MHTVQELLQADGVFEGQKAAQYCTQSRGNIRLSQEPVSENRELGSITTYMVT
jgi:hypothetical protein